MRDSFETHTSGTYGGVHTGSGDIYNYLPPQFGSAGRSPRMQPKDELRWLSRRFVAPAGMDKARDLLESFRTVFLGGPPGSGRVAAAKMLLWELRRDSGQLHELLPQEKDDAQLIDHSHIGEGDQVWLDLSPVDRPVWERVHDELSSLRAAVQKRDAHLVVVLPDTVDHLGSTLTSFRTEIQRPRVDKVLAYYLRAEEIPHPSRFPPLRFLAADRYMDEVPKYVRLIVRAREQNPQDDFVAWCETAHRALSGQEQDVADLVAELGEGPQRALLLTAAMLQGAHADIVHRASESLLKRVDHPNDERSLIVRTPLDRRLKEVGAWLDSSSNVQFDKLNYDAAVRSYFWIHMPELHDSVQEWVCATADSTDLTPHEREDLVERFAEQCLNERYRPALTSLVSQWTSHPTTGRKLAAAALVLQRGLRDKRHGRFFRRQIYDWSRTPNLSHPLAEVIIVACRDDMMANHPDEALVRLHHVARREHGTLARETLVNLVSDAPRLRRQMLSRLADPKTTPGKWQADIDLFLEIADPVALTDTGRRGHALITDNAVDGQLKTGWARTFTQRDHRDWAPQVRRWLQVAAEDEWRGHALLDVLIAGAEQHTDVLAHLYTMARTQCAPISTLVMQKINIAQGVQLA